MPNVKRKREVPIWERTLLTVTEAADYTGIGTHRLRELAEIPHTGLALRVGTRLMFKRKRLDEYLEKADAV